MRRYIRSPLTWAVLAEFVVVGALLVLAWHIAGSAARTGVALPAIAAPEAGPTDDGTSPPDIPTVTGQGARGPLPGLNLNSAFWRSRLAELNRDQAAVAQLEWRIAHAGMVAVKDYVEAVVLPAVRRAEGAVG
jgi:hypothetical protein